jgi:hypothetical protein
MIDYLIFGLSLVGAFTIGWYGGGKITEMVMASRKPKVWKLAGMTAMWGVIAWGCIAGAQPLVLLALVVAAYVVSVIGLMID